MSKKCAITEKSSKVAGRYSNSVRATEFQPCGKFRRKANLQKKRVFIPELGKTMRLTISAAGIRTLNKKGAYKALKDAGIIKAPKAKAKAKVGA